MVGDGDRRIDNPDNAKGVCGCECGCGCGCGGCSVGEEGVV